MRFSLLLMKIWWAYWNAIDRADAVLDQELPNIYAMIFLGAVSVFSSFFFILSLHFFSVFPYSHIIVLGALFLFLGLFLGPIIILYQRAKIRRQKFLRNPYSKHLYKSKENELEPDL